MRPHSRSLGRAFVLGGSERLPSQPELFITLSGHSDEADDERLTASGKCYLATPPPARLAKKTQNIAIRFSQVKDPTSPDCPSKTLSRSRSMGATAALHVVPGEVHVSEYSQESPSPPALFDQDSHSTVLEVWVEEEEMTFADENENSESMDSPLRGNGEWPPHGHRPRTPSLEFSNAPPPRSISLTRGTLRPKSAGPSSPPPLTKASLICKGIRKKEGAKVTGVAETPKGASTNRHPSLRRSKSVAQSHPFNKQPPSMGQTLSLEASTKLQEGSSHGYPRITSPGHLFKDANPMLGMRKPAGLRIITGSADVAEAGQTSQRWLPPKSPVTPKLPIRRTTSTVFGSLSFGVPRQLKKAATAPAERAIQRKGVINKRQQRGIAPVPMSSSNGGSIAAVAAKRALQRAKMASEGQLLPAGKDWWSQDMLRQSNHSSNRRKERGRVERGDLVRSQTTDRLRGGMENSDGLPSAGGSSPEIPGWKQLSLTIVSTEGTPVKDRHRTAGGLQRPRAFSPLPAELSGQMLRGKMIMLWGSSRDQRGGRNRKGQGRMGLLRENCWLHHVAGYQTEGGDAVPLDASRIIPGKSNRVLRKACTDPGMDGLVVRGGKGNEASKGGVGMPEEDKGKVLKSLQMRVESNPQTEACALHSKWMENSSSESESFHSMEGTENFMRKTHKALPSVAF